MRPSLPSHRAFVLAFAVLGLVSVAPANASALECRRRVIDTGDSEAYVRSLCGEPTSVMSRTITRSVFGYVQGAGAGAGRE
mgnify:FL=1